MKKLGVILYLSTGLLFAQQPRAGQTYVASVYGSWQSRVSTAGVTFVVAQPASVVLSNGQSIVPFAANTPDTINFNGSTQETVTPTVTNCFPGSINCTLSATFAHAHVAGETITSGTFGLQEAINAAMTAGAGTVLIDTTWQGTGSALITGAAGSVNVVIQDNRSGIPQFYQWNGSQYALNTPATTAYAASRQTYVLEDYLSASDGHGGTDYGYATTNFCATVGCSTLTAPVGLKTTHAGVCKVYSTMTIPTPIVFDGSSCMFVPQSTMASTPVSLSACSTTIGSTMVTCASTTGLSVGMAVGGDPTLGPAQYVASVVNGTQFTLALPASRNFLGIPTNGSATISGIDSQIDAAAGQSITGTGIPASTTISSINAASNTWSISNQATIGTLSPVDIQLAAGTVVSSLSLTAVAQTPIILVPPSSTSTSQAKPHGPNFGVTLEHVRIQDPTYSHSSFGRSLTGLVGIQVYGQDNLYLHDVMVSGIKGSALIYGGYVPPSTPDGSNVVRESEVDELFAYSDGDITTGQACLALMTGLGLGDTNQDEINQNGFHNVHCVYPDAEGLVIGSYLHPGTTNGPRLITFTGDNQFEAGSDSNYTFGAADMVRVLTGGGYNKILGGRWDTPGFGHSTFRISSAVEWTITGAEVGASGGSSEVYNVGLTGSSTTVTYTSAGTGGGSSFVTGSYWNGIGAQLNDSATGGTCNPCNVWLAPTGAVNSNGTQLTLASAYTGAQTSGTLTIQGGGYYFHLDQTLTGLLNSIGNSYIDQASPVISLLGLGSATNGFLVGTGALVSTPPGLTDHLQSWTLNNLIMAPTSYTANSSSRNINLEPVYQNSSGIFQTGNITIYGSVGSGTNPTVNLNDVCAICGGDFHHILQNNVAAGGSFEDLVAGSSSLNAYFSVNASSNSASWQMGLKGNALWTLFDNVAHKNAITVTPTTEAVGFVGPTTAPAFYPQTIAAGPYYNYFEDFTVLSGYAGSQIGTATTAGSYAASTTYMDNNHPANAAVNSGFSTSATGIGYVIVQNGGASPMFNASTNTNTWTWEAVVYVPVLPGTTAGTYEIGLGHSYSTIPWPNGINFTLGGADATINDWYCQYSSTSTDTTVAAAAAWTRLTIHSDGSLVHWYVNGTQVCGTGVAIASMPTGTLVPAYASVAGQETTSLSLVLDYSALQMQVTR